MFSYYIQIEKQILEETLTVRDKEVLHYRITYPKFVSSAFRRSLAQINRFYQRKAREYRQHCRTVLYAQAAEQVLYDPEGQFPIVPYEAILDFCITYNDDCVLSLYFDRYEFTGGAHGNTVRFSDTWGLQSGRRLPVSAFIAQPVYYKTFLIDKVLDQMRENIEAGEATYFEPHKSNVIENFHPENYFLARKGLVIYYQQYDIAPYSSGIQTFLIPYSRTVLKPRCNGGKYCSKNFTADHLKGVL